ncbi:chemotaxis protein CheW [Magnetospirillum molischianum]|uniref:Chemotaxis protein n=1 Tax=Magnetospirillum molischianum DSM 120 TaxID=1150626 RepID=H8FQY4_MAGML|nr:chemotaxis protein CheW [Magnetospirillum molischianum]CCG40772.1 Chemotaxis protein [Magnetospirillum molischianum DSM 120]
MTQTAVTRAAMQYVTIGIEREIFAVEVDQVREILDLRPLSRVPNAPSFLAGMIDVRGQGVPVIDLRTKLGLPPVDPTEHTRIVVLEVSLGDRQVTLGMISDRVIEVTSLAEHKLEPPPDVGVRWRSDYIRAIGRSGGAFVIILDLSRLFSSEEVALVRAEDLDFSDTPDDSHDSISRQGF